MPRKARVDPGQTSFVPPPEVAEPRRKRGGKKTDWSNQAEHGAETGPRLVVSQVQFEDGPMFRAKRLALGLSIGDLVSGRDKVRLLIDEDGRRQGQWWKFWPLLQKKFEQKVKDHVNAGLDPWDLRLNPWSMVEILKVVKG